MDDGALTLPIATAVIDQLVDCGEDEIVAALRAFAHEENQIVEGAAALALAGLMQVSRDLEGARVAVVTCGANFDPRRIWPLFG
jgi:threonine dehydratase